MENMARLAVLERALQKRHIFNEVLVQLYKTVSYILDDPQDVDAKVVNDPILSKVYDCTAFQSYMEYIGFQKLSNQYVFNRKASISRLKLAQAALDKKLNYVFGRNRPCLIVLPSGQDQKKDTYNMSTPGNPFLVRIQHLFNEMMKYEDKELQEEALRHMPLVKLQIKAMERMRDHQKKIKAGDTQVQEISFEMALLMELLGWFKYDFFSWVNEPQCERCNIPTKHIKTMENEYVEGERCRVEIYICQICRGEVQFPRLNNPRTLLRTRRGRCGEWANCFVLLCRAFGYDTRYVFDVSDHVWCEVYDIVSKCWLHVDPCEGRIDTPLMYSHGWGKKLSYVLAFSRDDLQDVTWRYTSNHKEVMSRRRSASEQDVVNTILRLRSYSYRRLSPARQRFLTLRNIAELASFMVERQPSDYEAQGRISGSIQWRTERGEVGKHVFVFDHPGDVGVSYCTSEDRYLVTRPGGADELATWASGAHESTGIFRKVETDWRQTYLARVEGEETGSISWRIQTDRPELQFQRLAARLAGAEYHSGVVRWSLRFDDEQPIHVRFDDSVKEFNRTFRSVTIRAELSGGLGDVAWQHAQLFRQSLEDKTPLFDIQLKLGVN